MLRVSTTVTFSFSNFKGTNPFTAVYKNVDFLVLYMELNESLYEVLLDEMQVKATMHYGRHKEHSWLKQPLSDYFKSFWNFVIPINPWNRNGMK